MIDCENEVYTRVATMLRKKFPGINVAGEYVNSPTAFPHVSITQNDSTTIDDKQTSRPSEELVEVMFEVNVYSNKTEGKKTECKTIVKAISDKMFSMNFKRTACTPVPNLEDATIYRITARFQVATDGKFFYRR